MTGPRIDYLAVFRHLPVPVLLLTPDFVIADANDAYLRVSGRDRDQLTGRGVFEAFPGDPREPSATGARNLRASLARVLQTGEADIMPLQRYDVEIPGSPGAYMERYWCPVNTPVPDGGGGVELIIHSVEEVSDMVRTFVAAQAANA